MSIARKAPRRPRVTRERVRPGTGNVFEDLRDPSSGESYVKAEIAAGILRSIERSGAAQAEVAARLGVDPPTVSNLVRGRLERFSVERLLRFLNALGHDVDIVVREKPRVAARKRRGTTRVSATRR